MTGPARITKHFITVHGRAVHYRRAGVGPAVVLLHGSPNSSAWLTAIITVMANAGFTAIALDTPGNGESDPLPGAQPETSDYASALNDTFGALGLQQAAVYGFHTGAGIAAEFTASHPEKVAALVLDGLALWSEQERTTWFDGYLPEFHPKWDGSHLTWLWARIMEQTIFFPWQIASPETRMIYDMHPPEALHDTVMEFLRSGDAYRAPYGAALRGDNQPRLARLQVPTLLTAQRMDPLFTHLDRVGALPSCVDLRRTELNRDGLHHMFADWLKDRQWLDAPAPPSPDATAGSVVRDYVDTTAGQYAIRKAGVAELDAPPLILLHDAGGSSRLFTQTLSGIDATRPLIAVDLPGHGESAEDFPDVLRSVSDFADHLSAAIEGLNITPDCLCTVAGFHLGGQIALDLAQRRQNMTVGIIGAPYFINDEQTDLLAHYAPPLPIDWAGGHLIKAWQMMRLQGLYYPWYRRNRDTVTADRTLHIDPMMVHRRTVDLLKARATYSAAYEAMFTFDTASAMQLVGARAHLLAADFDPLCTPARMSRLAEAAGTGRAPTKIGASPVEWAKTLGRFGT